MLTDNFFVVACKSGNGFQDELCHHLPGYQAKVDWPVVPCSLLEDRSDTCFPPDLRHLSQLLWPLKDLWEWPYTDSFLTTCGCVPSRPMSLGVSSWLKYSLTWFFSTMVHLPWGSLLAWPLKPGIPKGQPYWWRLRWRRHSVAQPFPAWAPLPTRPWDSFRHHPSQGRAPCIPMAPSYKEHSTSSAQPVLPREPVSLQSSGPSHHTLSSQQGHSPTTVHRSQIPCLCSSCCMHLWR